MTPLEKVKLWLPIQSDEPCEVGEQPDKTLNGHEETIKDYGSTDSSSLGRVNNESFETVKNVEVTKTA